MLTATSNPKVLEDIKLKLGFTQYQILEKVSKEKISAFLMMK